MEYHMDDSTPDYTKIDSALSALEREVTLLAYKSCRDSPDMAAIGRRRRLDKLNNKVIQVREAYQELIDYEKRLEENRKYMSKLDEDFGDLLKGR